MKVHYDPDLAARAAGVPAFEPGWYRAKVIGWEPGQARNGSKKVVIQVILKNAAGDKRQVKAHACYEHHDEWVRSAASLILGSLAKATGQSEDGSIDLDLAKGKVLEARATRKMESINGTDTAINYVAEFRAIQQGG